MWRVSFYLNSNIIPEIEKILLPEWSWETFAIELSTKFHATELQSYGKQIISKRVKLERNANRTFKNCTSYGEECYDNSNVIELNFRLERIHFYQVPYSKVHINKKMEYGGMAEHIYMHVELTM